MAGTQAQTHLTKARTREIERVLRRAPYPRRLKHSGSLRFMIAVLLLATAAAFSLIVITDPASTRLTALFCVMLTGSWILNAYYAHLSLKLRRLEWLRSRVEGENMPLRSC